jgi:hypothetical protein
MMYYSYMVSKRQIISNRPQKEYLHHPISKWFITASVLFIETQVLQQTERRFCIRQE